MSTAENLAENSGKGLLNSNSRSGAASAEEKCEGHVAQWKERLSHSGADAGSKPDAEVPPCPHTFGTRDDFERSPKEQEENKNQARSLERAPLSLKEEISIGEYLYKSFVAGSAVENSGCFLVSLMFPLFPLPCLLGGEGKEKLFWNSDRRRLQSDFFNRDIAEVKPNFVFGGSGEK